MGVELIQLVLSPLDLNQPSTHTLRHHIGQYMPLASVPSAGHGLFCAGWATILALGNPSGSQNRPVGEVVGDIAMFSR